MRYHSDYLGGCICSLLLLLEYMRVWVVLHSWEASHHLLNPLAPSKFALAPSSVIPQELVEFFSIYLSPPGMTKEPAPSWRNVPRHETPHRYHSYETRRTIETFRICGVKAGIQTPENWTRWVVMTLRSARASKSIAWSKPKLAWSLSSISGKGGESCQ